MGKHVKISLVSVSLVFILLFLVGAIYLSPHSKSPEQALSDYLYSVKNLNVDKAVAYIEDPYFEDKKSLKDFYDKAYRSDKLTDFSVTDVKQIDEKSMDITCNLKIDSMGETSHTFHMINKEGAWKVYIEPATIQQDSIGGATSKTSDASK
ncbi:DUF4878 domain-containing protein [Paenibacillus ferrarius]|uniref:DUF4878 domain-containing protein n=1 Tax=Paenibacillus ferrarius TaxID=1469647 RepID=UPI001301DEA0|nr:DUF4878 domain-containing protein [Paenibacillus ferrarius]